MRAYVFGVFAAATCVVWATAGGGSSEYSGGNAFFDAGTRPVFLRERSTCGRGGGVSVETGPSRRAQAESPGSAARCRWRPRQSKHVGRLCKTRWFRFSASPPRDLESGLRELRQGCAAHAGSARGAGGCVDCLPPAAAASGNEPVGPGLPWLLAALAILRGWPPPPAISRAALQKLPQTGDRIFRSSSRLTGALAAVCRVQHYDMFSFASSLGN